jgi:hypothetical protein
VVERQHLLTRGELLSLARRRLTEASDLTIAQIDQLAMGVILFDSEVRAAQDDLALERDAHAVIRGQLAAARGAVSRIRAGETAALRERDEARALLLDSAMDRASRGILRAPYAEASATLDELLRADPPEGLPWRDDPDTVVVDVDELPSQRSGAGESIPIEVMPPGGWQERVARVLDSGMRK